MRIPSGSEIKKDRKTILREKRLKEGKKKERKEKKEKLVNVRKIEEKESLREITVKIGLERIDNYKGFVG